MCGAIIAAMSVVTAWLPDRARVTARVLRPAPAGVYGTERTGDLPEATMRLSLPITRSTSRVRGGDYIEIGATRWEPSCRSIRWRRGTGALWSA